ncbi:MAG: hypothetical protein ACUVUQ_09020, partial [Thermodesulfovibrionales bacterium]
MKINEHLLEILVNKPELITNFPEWMLSNSTIQEIRKTENSAIVEIAGRDSIAASIRACEMRPIKAIIPTIAYTGTEYGNWEILLENVKIMHGKLQSNNIKVFDPIIIGSPKFWWILCGRYSTYLSKQFNFYSHCIGCHLYFHAIRIPIAKKLQVNIIIGGERELHDGKIKINQIKIALDTYQAFLKRFNLELFLPIRHIKSGKEIEAIIGEVWEEGSQQLECVLSKNYQEPDGRVLLNEEPIKQFFDKFALKKAEDIINGYLNKD